MPQQEIVRPPTSSSQKHVRSPQMSSFKVKLARNAPMDKKRPKMDMTGINYFDDDPIRPDSKGTHPDNDFITSDIKNEDSFVGRPADWP